MPPEEVKGGMLTLAGPFLLPPWPPPPKMSPIELHPVPGRELLGAEAFGERSQVDVRFGRDAPLDASALAGPCDRGAQERQALPHLTLVGAKHDTVTLPSGWEPGNDG